MINKIDDGSASLDFPDFCLLIGEKAKELDPETHFKDTFRVFSKDEEGKQVKVEASRIEMRNYKKELRKYLYTYF